MTFIPQRAEQEFYDELDERLAKQAKAWKEAGNDQNVFLLSPPDFDYLSQLSRQHQPERPMDTDEANLPILFFRGVRVKPS